jgi:hypothetical protein
VAVALQTLGGVERRVVEHEPIDDAPYVAINASARSSQRASVQNTARCSSVISAAMAAMSPAFCAVRMRSVVPSKPASSQMNA